MALNRTLILPAFTCYCDELWYWSLEVKPSYGCRWPGARNQTLPFACPHDQLVSYLQLEDNPAKYGSPVRYRESTFLENPRTPTAIKVCLELPQYLCSPPLPGFAPPSPPLPHAYAPLDNTDMQLHAVKCVLVSIRLGMSTCSVLSPSQCCG